MTSLTSILENLQTVHVADSKDALLVSASTKNIMSVFKTNRQFIFNNVGVLEVVGDYIVYDINLGRGADLIKNLKFENVHHYEFVRDSHTRFKVFPQEIVAACCVYMEMTIRLYFLRTDLPASFSLSYDAVMLPCDVRSQLILCNLIETENHTYRAGLLYGELENLLNRI